MNKSRLLGAVYYYLITLIIASTSEAALIDKYYVFSDFPDDGWVLQGTTAITTFAHTPNDLAIAVTDSIKALQWDNSGNGSEYDLNGNIISNGIYAPIIGFNGQVVDGASDGNSNYVGEWDDDGDIFSTDSNWGNGSLLFKSGLDVVGITYDLSSDSLWISDDSSSNIFNYDLTGNVLSSFNTNLSVRLGALAWESSSDTLWGIGNGTSTLYQFSKTGVLLDSFDITPFGNVWGGEFSVVPIPAAAWLFGSGLLGLIGISRRKKTA